jgi:hypothetical protein
MEESLFTMIDHVIFGMLKVSELAIIGTFAQVFSVGEIHVCPKNWSIGR